MEKEILQKLTEQNISSYQIANMLNISQGNVSYWLKKFDLKTHKISQYLLDKRTCPRCNTEKFKEDFYSKRGIKYSSSYCKVCTNEQTIERQQHLKQLAVDYKGGQCIKCEYHKCLRAMEFHHTNPNEKDFSISDVKSSTLNDTIKKELDKCILVCSNCHREIHDELDKTPSVAPPRVELGTKV